MIKKIFLFILILIWVTPCFCYASDDITVSAEPFEYKVPAISDGDGGFSVRGIFYTDSSLYFISDSKSFDGKYALISADVNGVLLNNLDFLNYYSEYSDLVYYGMNGKYAVYDISNRNSVCELGSVFGLSYGGRFGEDGGFFTLTDGKLHFVGNNGKVGTAVDIDYDKYKNSGYYVSTWDYLGNGNFKLVLHTGCEPYIKTIGILNSSGEVLVYADSVDVLYDNYYIIKNYGKYGIVDKNGKEIAPCIYNNFTSVKSSLYDSLKKDAVSTYTDGMIFFAGFNYGIVNPKNRVDMSLDNRYTHYYFGNSEDIFVLCLATNSSDPGLYGCIDGQGEVVIPFEYSYISDFTDGIAVAKKDGKYGYIDVSGKAVIPFMYSDAEPFLNGEAYVSDMDGNRFKIDMNNEVVSESDVTFVPEYRLTENVDTNSSDYYTGEIEITSSGKTADISSLKLLPFVLGSSGEYVMAFSTDFGNMYRLNITDTSPHTKTTVKSDGENASANITLINSESTSAVIFVTYKDERISERFLLKSTDDLTDISFDSDCDKIKVMVWDDTENISPLMYSETIPKSRWILN